MLSDIIVVILTLNPVRIICLQYRNCSLNFDCTFVLVTYLRSFRYNIVRVTLRYYTIRERRTVTGTVFRTF